jgi:hypothetical protein
VRALLDEVRALDEQSLEKSPWRDDPALAGKPSFPLERYKTVAQALGAISDQTGYAVLGTYFDGHDASLPSGVSAEEPIFLLLNRMAKDSRGSWKLVGPVILWRHKDWFLLENDRRSNSKDSANGMQP